MNLRRNELVKDALHRKGYNALVCRTPQNVVMLTGYQPILGNSFCLVSLNHKHEPEIRLAVPAEEQDLVPQGSAVEVRTFVVETLDTIGNSLDAARQPLGELLHAAGIGEGALVGYEGAVEPIIPAYTQLGVPSPETRALLQMLLIGGHLRDATSLLNELAAIKTEEDLVKIRQAEAVGWQGFQAAREAIKVDKTEADIVAATYAALIRAGYTTPTVRHVQPHVHVMAGERAALAYRAFNLTSNARIRKGDTVTVQMEIGIDGYWAELTRTFFVESASDEWVKVQQSCVEAQKAALKTIRAGANARNVDAAARQVMEKAGFGKAFKHGLGHGFGFQAINHAASPVLHPASQEVLSSGMVHNMEPAVYLEGKGGFRLNDNVAVQADGNELLSAAIPQDLEWLVV